MPRGFHQFVDAYGQRAEWTGQANLDSFLKTRRRVADQVNQKQIHASHSPD